MSIRPVKRSGLSKPTMEGAGVRLRRAFGFGETGDIDPFLLFDDFRGDRPADYQAGFPWHPHRGIETITYVLAGNVDHADSLGNQGTIGVGDVQWMTAGSGIIHQEMPHGDAQGRMHGFQLWANLPASMKMTDPRYQEIKATDIPTVTENDGTTVRIVCGTFWGQSGPVEGVAADPQYLDVWVPPGRRRSLPVDRARNVFAYVFAGSGRFAHASEPRPVLTERIVATGEQDGYLADNRSLIVFDA
ncbi:MAG: pirin family protein, partial [Vicinamibacterales bacterium]|nr:pirin family protein [Vicinamibacterales bacterium]